MSGNFEHFSDAEYEDLIKTFYSQSYDILEELQDLVLKLESGNENFEVLKAIQRHFHTLKGDSTSIGLSAVSALCHRIEDVLTLLREKTGAIDKSAIGLLLSSIDKIEKHLRAGETGANTGAHEELDEMISEFLNSAPGTTKAGRVTEGFTEYEVLHMEEAARTGKKLYQFGVSFHPLCAEKSVAAFMLLQRLNALGELISSDPDIRSEETVTADRITAIFSSDSDIDKIREKLRIVGITEDINVVPFEYAGPAEGSELQAAEHYQSSEGLEIRPTAVKSELLRIEASKVDWIMNLVGELIIGRSIIDQIARDAEEGTATTDTASRLFSVNAYMERTVSDLQKGIMKLRMVQINQVFRKFPKIVREISSDRGKKVSLEIYGRERELDKGIVDALGEPLLHLIRNAIDHGIEEPSLRTSSGKQETGVITICAYQEGTQIVIEVSDDGRGIDLSRLKKKVLEKGFMSSTQLERLSDAEATDLIFLSGLSTSDSVSDISGRGIGMDAVKTAVENMKGSIEVKSTLGSGSRFTIRLPLTLAVIKALQVEVGDRIYALPVSAIAEVTRVMLDDLVSVDGRSTLVLRDRIISVIHMDALFGIGCSLSPRKFVLVLGIGHKRIGLLVDRLVGQQELVIKAVDSNYVTSGLVAGASILGNGKVILILDAAAIFKKAIEDEKNRMIEK